MSPQVLGQIWCDAIGALFFFIFGQLLPTDEMLKTKLSFKINGKYLKSCIRYGHRHGNTFSGTVILSVLCVHFDKEFNIFIVFVCQNYCFVQPFYNCADLVKNALN